MEFVPFGNIKAIKPKRLGRNLILKDKLTDVLRRNDELQLAETNRLTSMSRNFRRVSQRIRKCYTIPLEILKHDQMAIGGSTITVETRHLPTMHSQKVKS